MITNVSGKKVKPKAAHTITIVIIENTHEV